jgi:hypothetical protein
LLIVSFGEGVAAGASAFNPFVPAVVMTVQPVTGFAVNDGADLVSGEADVLERTLAEAGEDALCPAPRAPALVVGPQRRKRRADGRLVVKVRPALW